MHPARELHIDYQQGEDGGTVIVYLVKENGRWTDDFPCASEQSIEGIPRRRERKCEALGPLQGPRGWNQGAAAVRAAEDAACAQDGAALSIGNFAASGQDPQNGDVGD